MRIAITEAAFGFLGNQSATEGGQAIRHRGWASNSYLRLWIRHAIFGFRESVKLFEALQSVLCNSAPVGKGSQGGLLGRMDY